MHVDKPNSVSRISSVCNHFSDAIYPRKFLLIQKNISGQLMLKNAKEILRIVPLVVPIFSYVILLQAGFVNSENYFPKW